MLYRVIYEIRLEPHLRFRTDTKSDKVAQFGQSEALKLN